MCGIFYIIKQKEHSYETITKSINKIQHRGPDKTIIKVVGEGDNIREIIGFHRLQINGLTEASNQPMTFDEQTYLICNGEIYNHLALQRKYGIQCTTGSDCEIILHLFEKIGFENTVRALDGEFALAIITPEMVYVARDPYGVRALYIAVNVGASTSSTSTSSTSTSSTSTSTSASIGIASEGKALFDLFPPSTIRQFLPGHIAEWSKIHNTYNITPYYNFTSPLIHCPSSITDAMILKTRELLLNAVKKRIMCSRIGNTENGAPALGAYLSGGFDSSAIAAILQKELTTTLETFSIGFKDSPDLFYARKVADHIGSNHHEYIITEEQALNAIPHVIRMIETYDITTIRASTMMYLLSEYISKNSKAVVMFSGEGSDEASGSYRYFHNAPSPEAFHAETLRLLQDLCYFDNLRADKSTAAWGLELRVPFLDLDFLNYYMTLPSYVKTCEGMEKYLLRKAVCDYLPADVLYRPKEAMSDGVSNHGRSWSSIIQEYILGNNTSSILTVGSSISTSSSTGLDAEKTFYLDMFNTYYPECLHQIPYYWLPKWCGDVTDPSARVLSIYNATVPEINK